MGWRIYTELQRTDVGFMAGSVAYQAFMSLLPLLVVLFLIVAVVAGPSLAGRVLGIARSFLPVEAQQLLVQTVTGKIDATTTSVISVALLLWAGLGLFKGLDTAFSAIYGTKTKNSFTNQLTDALVAFGGILVAIVAAVGAASAPFLSRLPFVGLIASVLLLVGLTAAFFPIYYLFPDAPVTVWEALPGAAIAAVGWTILQALFQLYVRFAADTDVSGALGTVLILLTWLYFGSFLILFGAVVNVSLFGRHEAPAER